VQSGLTRRSLYLKNICDQQSPSLVYPRAAYRAIRADQASALAKLLEQKTLTNGVPRSHFQAFLYGLLEFSVTCQSRRCVRLLIAEELPKNGVVIEQNYLNHHITITGRSSMRADSDNSEPRTQELTDRNQSETGTSLFLLMLDHSGSGQNAVLQTKYALGRLPLQYGALYGLTAICQSILNSLQERERSTSAAAEAVLSVDCGGYTPLHSAVIRNDEAITRLFLDTLKMHYQTGDEAGDRHLRSLLGGLLLIALKSQYDDVVYLLVPSHIDINHHSSRGETALYVAVQIRREDYVRILLKATSGENTIDVLSETIYGWTPLFIACAEGHLAVVELLLQAGASQKVVDHLDWTAKEHAAFRGHLAVAELLEMCETGDPAGGPASTPFKTAAGAKYHLRTGHSHIIANLGVMQKGKQVTAINLDCLLSEHIYNLHTDTRFSIEVTAPGERGSSHLVQLPILDDMITEPFLFPVKNSSEALLMFKIFCATSAHEKKGFLVGSGMALLQNNKHCFGEKHESPIREHTVPILEKEILNLMGTVTFTFVIAESFTHLNTPALVNYPIKESDTVQVVGHRGMFSICALRRQPILIREKGLVRTSLAANIFSWVRTR
jgi:glycerophosphodiester phosphodiesterase